MKFGVWNILADVNYFKTRLQNLHMKLLEILPTRPHIFKFHKKQYKKVFIVK